MTAPTSTINKALRKHVSPLLRQIGFEKVDSRNGWAWKSETTMVVTIRAVGKQFGDVTGWPPSSVCVWLGVNYSFMPCLSPLKLDLAGRALPAEHECHMRSHLKRELEQKERIESLSNPAERERRDIWWLDPNGENAEEVACDLASSLQSQAIPWFASCLDLESAFLSIESESDCFVKFVRASYLAKRIGRNDAYKRYSECAEKEARRIHLSPSPDKWFAAYA